ncbi:hemerythrin domain-containing protein [Streptomyces sp. DSM 42041]|uniref:Hemerythrin domain-containing protein n=1 Tax=Streptomyces hazeniae TaxID=3075538 RepID=A0ABU2NLH6_9ACTN|nr:hemerythrin domain-containing protein [Streptomyces sp. DSM 42041]MDT0377831.1 hemerythrin domain-containing protein [Streptomyces sp. DSM 42041]
MSSAHNDVVELILKDHRRMEELFRTMRNAEADRAGALAEFANLLIAHGEAEEEKVYPDLARRDPVDEEDVEHGVHEHQEGNEALLALLEIADTSSDAWDEKLEDLVAAVTHHLDEEERTLLNDAREHVPDARRAELAEAFVMSRAEHLDAACGSPANVRAVVERGKREGKGED